jgi:cell division protein FtsB
MTTAQIWTILGPLLGVFGVLVVLIIQQGNSLRSDLAAKIDQQTARIDQQTARIDQQTARIDQVVKDIGELKGDMKIVKDRLKIPMSA